jgi:hypothetical protein
MSIPVAPHYPTLNYSYVWPSSASNAMVFPPIEQRQMEEYERQIAAAAAVPLPTYGDDDL